MVRTFLARQVGDEGATVWLHLREGQPVDRTAFVSELKRLQDISRAVPQIEPVLYGDAGGFSAWVACRRSDGICIKDATCGADLGATALRMVLEVARAIERCHELGWYHGALGPDRVFITSQRDYCIRQFGLVRLFRIEPHEAARERLVAPELLSGDDVGPRADVYGLGALLYELACRCPLDIGQTGELGAPWLSPVIPTDLPRAVAATIEMALAEDPRRRYRNVDHFITVLEDLVDAWPTLDQTPSGRAGRASVAGAAPSTLRSSHLEGPQSPASITVGPDTPPSEVAPGVVSSGVPPSNEDDPPLPQVPPLDVPSRPASAAKQPVLPPPPSLIRQPERDLMAARRRPSGTPPRSFPLWVAASLAVLAAICTGVLCLTRPARVVLRAEKHATILVERISPPRKVQRSAPPPGSAPTVLREADSRPRAALSRRTGVAARADLHRPYCEVGDVSCGPALY
ncbi:protein kinase domain-containing protein [Sorangium sp. So ce362]|uniref:protein kinase domain-containing protein n=1 Tax=Sorangium sp. So ce362 TaxID=3133303 RepID=UPI003F6370E6